MATVTIESSFEVTVGAVTATTITVDYLAGQDGTSFVNDGSVDVYANSLRVNLTPTGTPEIGTLYWDTDHDCPAIKMNADVSAQIPLESMVLVVNKTGVTISDGDAVYISGAQGNRPTIALGKADALGTSRIIAVATQDIANNAEGFVTTFGEVHDFDTSGFTEGDTLYLSASTAGVITNTAPTTPNYLVELGTALNSTVNGKILLSPKIPVALDTALTLDSDLVVPSQKAVKAYVDDNAGGGGIYRSWRGWFDAVNTTNYVGIAATINYNNEIASDTGQTNPLSITGLAFELSFKAHWIIQEDETIEEFRMYLPNGNRFTKICLVAVKWDEGLTANDLERQVKLIELDTATESFSARTTYTYTATDFIDTSLKAGDHIFMFTIMNGTSDYRNDWFMLKTSLT